MKKVVIRVMSIILSCVVLLATFLVSVSAESVQDIYSLSGKTSFAGLITTQGGCRVMDDEYTVSYQVVSPAQMGSGIFTFNFPQPFSMEKGKQYKISYNVNFNSSGVKTNFNIALKLNNSYAVANNNYSISDKDIIVTQTYTAGKTMTISSLNFGVTFNSSESTSTYFYATFFLNSVSVQSVWEAGAVPTGDVGNEIGSGVQDISNVQAEIFSQVDKGNVDDALGGFDDVYHNESLIYASSSVNGILDKFFKIAPEIKVLSLFALMFGLAVFIIGVSIIRSRGDK